MNKFDFKEESLIGHIVSVDTNVVIVEIDNNEILSILNVGSIVAIETYSVFEHIIGYVEKVRRKGVEDVDVNDNDSNSVIIDDDFFNELNYIDMIQISILGTFKAIEGDKRKVYKRGIDKFPFINHRCYFLDGSNLTLLMKSVNNTVTSNKRLVLGNFVIDKDVEAIIDGNKFFQKHAAILGSTGSGKSWCIANIIEEASKLENPNIIVFDLHGEYKSLTENSNDVSRYGEYYKIAGPNDKPDNDHIIFTPLWLLDKDEIENFILKISENSKNQKVNFIKIYKKIKNNSLEEESTELQENTDNVLIDSPYPYKSNKLCELMEKDSDLKTVASRFKTSINDKRYNFMYCEDDILLKDEWLSNFIIKLIGTVEGKKGIKIIDFSEVPSDILPLIMTIFARLLFQVQFWMNEDKRIPFAILCDEAHLYLQKDNTSKAIQKHAVYYFEKIAKEGRKYGISLVVISQRPSDINTTILSQCNNFITLRLTNEYDKATVKNLLPDSMKSIFDTLPILNTGEAIILGDSVLLPSKIKLKKPKLEPRSVSFSIWNDWDSKIADNAEINNAVNSMRTQSR